MVDIIKYSGLFLFGIFLLLPQAKGYAQQDIYMKLQAESFQPIPIIISKFNSRPETDLVRQIRQIVMNDLNLSGFFRVLDEDENPLLAGTNGLINLANARLEADAELSGARITLQTRLIELPSNQIIFKKKFDGALLSHRYLAHQIADEVVYYLVGEKGIATSKIAFTIVNKTGKEIALIDYDGYGLQTLTANRSLNLSPAWSPDGKKIVYTSYQNGKPALFIYHVSGKRSIRIPLEAQMASAPAWSPDGKKIAFTLSQNGNSDIYTVSEKGIHLQKLTGSPAIDSSPSWSSDGREIAFTSDRSGNPQVYLMDSEGGNVRRLTFEGNYNDSPAWSPRGDLIAYVSRESGGFQIYTIDVTGENIRRLTDGGNNENPSWAPDGLHLAFASNRDGKWDIYIMNWIGSNLRKITGSGGNMAPKWSPRLDFY